MQQDWHLLYQFLQVHILSLHFPDVFFVLPQPILSYFLKCCRSYRYVNSLFPYYQLATHIFCQHHFDYFEFRGSIDLLHLKMSVFDSTRSNYIVHFVFQDLVEYFGQALSSFGRELFQTSHDFDAFVFCRSLWCGRKSATLRRQTVPDTDCSLRSADSL